MEQLEPELEKTKARVKELEGEKEFVEDLNASTTAAHHEQKRELDLTRQLLSRLQTKCDASNRVNSYNSTRLGELHDELDEAQEENFVLKQQVARLEGRAPVQVKIKTDHRETHVVQTSMGPCFYTAEAESAARPEIEKVD